MRLKTWATVFAVFGVLLLVCWPFIVGTPPPKSAPKPEQLRFVVRYGSYLMVLLVTFFVTTVLSLLLVRRARLQFKEQSRKNFEELVEGTLKDHARKQR